MFCLPRLPKEVRVVEVGPRDGLQNEPVFLPTNDKVELIDRLVAAGCTSVECSSFVSPKWIPQLRDAEDVFTQLKRVPGVEYSALVPNSRGLSRALQAPLDTVAVFISASETHNKKNLNQSIAESLDIQLPLIREAKSSSKRVRGYISMVFGCPFEGAIDINQVMHITDAFLEAGVDELSLGDTIGIAVPNQVAESLEFVKGRVPIDRIALHFHDTRGTALANVLAGLYSGVTTYDSSIGGLGGCPYAAGAAGNLATDDLVSMLERMGIDTGLDTARLAECTAWLEQRLGRPLTSRAREIARRQQEVQDGHEHPSKE